MEISMKNRIIALFITLGASGAHAFDENASRKPWKATDSAKERLNQRYVSATRELEKARQEKKALSKEAQP